MASPVSHNDSGALRRHLRRRLRAIFGERFREARLFGSFARGDAGPESDLDVLVVLQGPVDRFEEYRRLGDLVVDLMERYGVYVSPLVVEEHDYDAGSGPLLQNVREEGVAL